MSSMGVEDSVADWAIEHPESIAVFQKYGVDYCCGGRSLAYACHTRDLDPAMVLDELRSVIHKGGEPVDDV